jgi:hypothetical protein
MILNLTVGQNWTLNWANQKLYERDDKTEQVKH